MSALHTHATRRLRRNAIASALALALAGAGTVVYSPYASAQQAAPATQQYSIPAGSLREALDALAAQGDVSVMYSPELVAGKTTKGVSGRYTPVEALRRLLTGSGLAWDVVNGATFVLKRTPVAPADASTVTKPDTSPSSSVTEMETIVVVGTNIRGVSNPTAPVIMLDREYIDSTGSSTATRLLETLPQNFALGSQSSTGAGGNTLSAVQGSGVNLRGVGEGTSLVLLNGHRLPLGFAGAAVDISALPLTAIDRVEVLTDGASAIYGSDAVGGVVNFVLRRDFDGAESRLRYGAAAGGIDEYRVGQTLGRSWSTGNALVSLEYYKRDLLHASDRDFVPSTSDIGSLLPRDETYSLMFSGRQQVTPSFSLFSDILFTKRKSYNEAGRVSQGRTSSTSNPQLSSTVGFDWDVGTDWRMTATGGYAKSEIDLVQSRQVPSPTATTSDSRFRVWSAQLKADGPVAELPGGAIRLAAGLDWRSESLDLAQQLAGGPILRDVSKHETVRSFFGELLVPLVGEANSRPGVDRLSLSLAARYDDYSNFGSSFDPRAGIMWQPAQGLRIRASYGTSYVAPRLVDFTFAGNGATAFYFPDPGLAGETSHILQLNGVDVDSLSPQTSKSFSIGADITPSAVPGLKLGVNYYNIKYEGRIADPPFDATVLLANPSAWGGLVIRNPTRTEVEDAINTGDLGSPFLAFDPNFIPISASDFDPTSVDVLVDLRRRNLAVVQTNGIDLTAQYSFAAFGGDLSLGLGGTYILHLEQQLSSDSASFETVDTIYNPPNWRARASLGFERGGLDANIFIDHKDGYFDNRVMPSAPIDSYTTVDIRLAYDFSVAKPSGRFAGFQVSAGVQDLFDRAPPAAAVLILSQDMGFDPTNANPLGRLVFIELTKQW